MKLFIRCMAAVVALTAAIACTDTERIGADMAGQLQAAWGDTTELRAFVDRYDAMCDSFTFPLTAVSVGKEMISIIGVNHNCDSLDVAVRLVGLPIDDFGQYYSDIIVAKLLDGSFTSQHASDLLVLVDGVASMLGRERWNDSFLEALDARAAEMSVKDQMRLFSLAASPATLGEQLRADRKAGVADAELQQRIDALREIYDKQQFDEFFNSYSQP